VKIQHPDEKYFKKILTTATAAGEKLHPNVVAVLFVTVLICCC